MIADYTDTDRDYRLSLVRGFVCQLCHPVTLSPCRLWSAESLVASAAGRPAFIVHFMANCNFHFNLRCTAVEGKPAEHTLLCYAHSVSRLSLISRLGSTSTVAAYNFVYNYIEIKSKTEAATAATSSAVGCCNSCSSINTSSSSSCICWQKLSTCRRHLPN